MDIILCYRISLNVDFGGDTLELNEKIRIVRKYKKISQVEVARSAGMSVSSYNMKEMGNRTIKSGEFEKIAEALGETPEVFYAKNFHDKWNLKISTA